MPTNLTGSSINETYSQLLHIDGGPAAALKTVYSATGVATALKVGTGAVLVDNIKLDGNTLSSTNTDGDISITPDGSGEINLNGTVNTSALAATGGSLSGVSVPAGDITGLFYGHFYKATDQALTANTPAEVSFGETVDAAGVSIVSDTQVTFSTAGVYRVAATMRFANSDSSNHEAYAWLRKNGGDIAGSAVEAVVLDTTDGGVVHLTLTMVLDLAANDYVELVVATNNANVSLGYQAALATPGDAYDRPVIPAAVFTASRVA